MLFVGLDIGGTFINLPDCVRAARIDPAEIAVCSTGTTIVINTVVQRTGTGPRRGARGACPADVGASPS